MATTSKAAKGGKSGTELMGEVLSKAGKPLHVKIIAERTIALDKAQGRNRRLRGATPTETLSAALTMSHVREGQFVKVAPGVFALREWPASKRNAKPELPEGLRQRKAPAKATSSRKRGSQPSKGKGAQSRKARDEARVAAATTVVRQANAA